MFEHRISIFTGHFGSGKSEVAVNYALRLSESGKRTVLVDLDIVNPYFRSADVKKEFEMRGITVIAPLYANTNVDVPALPGEINKVFERKDLSVVLDVGGDDMGAKAVSRYRDEIMADDYEMFYVVNPRRPMTGNAADIAAMLHEIEESARIKMQSLVNNGNLLYETTVESIVEDHSILKAAAAEMNLPIGFLSCFKEYAVKLEEKLDVPVLRMDKHIMLPW